MSSFPEQRAGADPADVEQHPEEGSGTFSGSFELPADANESDVLEQRQDVPVEDEDEDGRET